jgi:zinc protease
MFNALRSNIIALMLAVFAPMLAQAMPSVQAMTLNDATPLWLIQDESLPIVSMRFTFKAAGSISDPEGKQGRAELAAAMLLKGAGSYDALGFANALADKAIALSVNADADVLTVSLKCLREFAPDAVALLRTALTKPNFDASELENAKAQHLAQLRILSESPSYRAARQLETNIYRGHPYGSPSLGTPETVASITPEDLANYRTTFLTQQALGIAVAGAMHEGELRELLQPLLAALPQTVTDTPKPTHIAMQPVEATLRDTVAAPQSAINFALPWIGRKDPDFYAAYMLHMVIGGSSLSSLLSTDVRREDGLVYDIGTQMDLRDGSAVLVGRAATRNASVDEVIRRIRETITKVQTRGLSETQCDDTRSFIIGNLPLQLDSTENLSVILALMQREDLGTDYLEKRSDYFEKVTCDDVNRVAKKLLDPAQIVFSVSGGAAGDTTP